MMASATKRNATLPGALEVWGGIECSITRIGDGVRDQMRETGHDDRPGDLDRIAALGIRTVRYPMLWERAFRSGWAATDARMEQIRALGLRVVGGLVHHGAGPLPGGLLDDGFPEGLASHAADAADRYSDVAIWTPVNEPLTTARFGCLYAVWHPHAADEASFLRATVLQCHGVLLAMRAIRLRIAHARLLQTEDVGRVFATAPLAGQARFENERRWLSLDLLCGRVDRAHPWRDAFERCGADVWRLDELASGEGRPDIIGTNHYVTSDRFLDHRTARYPAGLRGGNQQEAYADTEAARVEEPGGATGWLPRLREVWERYGLPIVVSEAQLGGDDEIEQLRWFMEAWDAAETLRAEGVPVQAVTAWAMAGAVDWDSLMQVRAGHFESGVWNGARPDASPRLIASALASLAAGSTFSHPALDEPGWWRREDRFAPVRLSA